MMETIKYTIQSVMRGLEAKKRSPTADSPEALLKKFLTKKELNHIKFSYFKRGIVNIGVDSSSWLYHLNLQKEALLEKFARQTKTVKDIRFRLGDIK